MVAMLCMSERALLGKPALTRATWETLKEWYLAHCHSLPVTNGAVKLSSGSTIGLSSIEHELKVSTGLFIGYDETVYGHLHQLRAEFDTNMN